MSLNDLNKKFGKKKGPRKPLGPVFEKIKASSKPKKMGQGSRVRAGDDPVVTQAEGLVSLLAPHRKRAIEVWIAGMDATKETYDPKSREYTITPDWKERRECAAKIIEHLDGTPVQKTFTLTGSFKDLGEMMQTLTGSPEAARMLSDSIEVEASVQETGDETGDASPSVTFDQ